MAVYVIMEPRQKTPATVDAVFIRDGFAFLAFLVPFIWLLWHRLWIEAALALGAVLLIGALAEVGGYGFYASLLSLLVSIYVGLEGAALRIGALRRRGWRDVAVVEADSAAEAEIRYYGAVAAEPEADVRSMSEPVQRPAAIAAPSGPALGLFSYPSGR
ncbi:DUF2628 domain-containing protein [Mesorhizobium sp. 1B3]|uniref:DUF2628 domain-containing protein n=1 Tax=Mesorhizobium sp. 1B3 TaxID=3243599 RepID=UPI003D967DC4